MSTTPAGPPSHEDLVAAVTRAVEAACLKLNTPSVSVSHHAYQAGLRDAYLKVLRTLGVDFTPEGFVDRTAPRLAATTATGPDHNDFSDRRPAPAAAARRTTIVDTPAEPVDFAALQAEITEGVTA